MKEVTLKNTIYITDKLLDLAGQSVMKLIPIVFLHYMI